MNRQLLLRWGTLVLGLFFASFGASNGQTNGLLDLRISEKGEPRVTLSSTTNVQGIFEIDRSTNLVHWATLGRFVRAADGYEDRSKPSATSFYVARRVAEGWGDNRWASQFHPLASDLSKFLFLTNDAATLYFHSSGVLHQQFASTKVPGLQGMSASALDDIALYPSRQKVVLGGLHVRNGFYGVEFVTYEPYSPETLLKNFRTVASRMAVDTNRLVYVPNAREREFVLANRAYFETNGMPIREFGEIYTNSTVQSTGWSIGVLKYVATTNLEPAMAAGQITRDTILLTDSSPRDLSPVAGLISLTPSSPHSHTVLRLQSSLLPYLDLPVAFRDLVADLEGKEVLLVTIGLNRWHLLDTSTIAAEVLDELRTRQSTAVTPPEVQRVGRYWMNVSMLGAEHVKHFGSKAANYGFVYRSVPGTLPGIGLSFDLWEDFMAQTMQSGKTLKTEIQERIAPLLTGTNGHLVSAILDDVRDMIKGEAVFNAQQEAAIREGLAIFNPAQKIRFRSSSNCEDLPKFSAAGLHDSYSGCLLDDNLPLEPNVCRCDPQDDKRRSVFAAIQKVYASLYNDQAFLERRVAGIEEEGAAMGVLVHHSFPDEIELANGVANVDFSGGVQGYNITSQRGAVSVVNPEGFDLPEIVTGESQFSYPSIQRLSTMRPPGASVLEYPAEYQALLQKFNSIGQSYFEGGFNGGGRLNFEFKKTAEGLFVKQVRPVYTGNEIVPAVMMQARYRVTTYQGHLPFMFAQQSTLRSTHELKSWWDLEVRGGVLTKTNSDYRIYDRARGAYLKNGVIVTNEFHFVSGRLMGTNEHNRNEWLLQNDLRSSANESLTLSVTFPVYSPASNAIVDPARSLVQLSRSGTSGVADLVRTDAQSSPRSFAYSRTNTVSTNGINVTSVFVAQAHEDVPIVGLGPTYDVREWTGTTITGLTAIPFSLRGFFSQTYKAGRHNSSEFYIFQPSLEEGISVESLNQLAAANIKEVHMRFEFLGPMGRVGRIQLVGFDGATRDP